MARPKRRLRRTGGPAVMWPATTSDSRRTSRARIRPNRQTGQQAGEVDAPQTILPDFFYAELLTQPDPKLVASEKGPLHFNTGTHILKTVLQGFPIQRSVLVRA